MAQGLTANAALLPHSSPEDGSAGNKRRPRFYWRTTVAWGAVVVALVLVTNISVLAYVVHNYSIDNGVAEVYKGSCDSPRKVTLWVDLVVNVFSTLLLGASNHCSQLLSAPTRGEINRAHIKAKWLDVGVHSLRNLPFVSPWRRRMWWALAFSSIPLHLFYNSVVFSTLSATDYQAALVMEEFVHGGWWNQTRYTEPRFGEPNWNNEFIIDQIVNMQQMATNLKRLENVDCLQAYGTSMLESAWRNVLVITSDTVNDPTMGASANDTLMNIFLHQPTSLISDLTWPCDGRNSDGSNIDGSNTDGSNNRQTSTKKGAPCNVKALIAKADSWVIANGTYCVPQPNTNCSSFSAPIKYCLAEPFEAACTVRVSIALLSVVILMNVVKLVCLVSTASWGDSHRPLATTGDAVSSFLQQPDAVTAGQGALPARDVWELVDWKKATRARRRYQEKPFQRKRWFWLQGTSAARAALCIVLCVAALIAGFALLGQGINDSNYHTSSLSDLWSEGIGTPTSFNTVLTSIGGSLTGNVLLANLAQLIISFIYLFYNSFLTGMLLAHESALFAKTPKTLRVSQPTGVQRGTYWLQLPWVYGVPLLTAMALLHWLVSRSIFLLQISIFDSAGNLDTGRAVDACGYSPIAMLLAVLLGAVMSVTLLCLAFRRLEAGMPVVGSCSIAIAAACHHAQPGAEGKALMYGVIDTDAGERKCGDEEDGESEEEADGDDEHKEWERRERRCVGFSSEEVSALIDGELYR